MRSSPGSTEDGTDTRVSFGVGARLTTWILLLFVITMIVFVALDIRHEARFAESLGAGEEQRANLMLSTLALHAVHVGVTVLVFGLAIHLLVRRLISRRVAAIVLAVRHFRRGTWQVSIPARVRDEIEWLTEAFRQLGPDLERKLATFVGVDRKSVVARLGARYQQRLNPAVQEILSTARERSRTGDTDPAWREVEEQAMKILAELGGLGRPDHPVSADIVNFDQADRIVDAHPYDD